MKVKVKDQTTGKILQYETQLKLKPATLVILNTGQNLEVAQVVCNECHCEANVLPYEQGEGEIEREVNKQDQERLAQLKEKAISYLPLCKEKIRHFDLRMNLLDADLSLDENKITFYFGSSERVDFRQLVVDLAREIKKIIRLQQVGSRDEARCFGGFGACGQEVCCKRFLGRNLSSVTLEAAKSQDLDQVNAAKISGLCGKLMCCLAYEKEVYEELGKGLPQTGDKVKIKQGEGAVVNRNILAGELTVKIEGNFYKVKAGEYKK